MSFTTADNPEESERLFWILKLETSKVQKYYLPVLIINTLGKILIISG